MTTIQTTQYGLKKQVAIPFEEAVKRVQELLLEEGFGILTTIDVQQTLKKKLDILYDKYLILGACHPQSAYKALKADKEIGLLLPCNVIVYEEDNQVVVSAIRPTIALSLAKHSTLAETAQEIENKLKNVLEKI